MKNLIDKITMFLNEAEISRMVHWVKTFSKNHSLDPKKSGWHEECVKHMEDEMGEDGAAAYCARALDAYKGSTYWRSGRSKKSEKEKAQDVESHQNYPKTKTGRKQREKALKD